jgi:hypothetical protein
VGPGGRARLDADVARLRELATASGGRVGLVTLPGAGRTRCVLDLDYATSGSSAYPREVQRRSRIEIELGLRYPFQPPKVTVLTPVFHPHVFPSGIVCIGARWSASEGMDLFVRRIARLLAYDPLLVNPGSIANPAAFHWYESARRRHPEAFPTDAAAVALGVEADPAAAGTRVTRSCPQCASVLRLPAGRSGTVRCPRCSATFAVCT